MSKAPLALGVAVLTPGHLAARRVVCAGPPEGHAQVEQGPGHVLFGRDKPWALPRSMVGRQEVPRRGHQGAHGIGEGRGQGGGESLWQPPGEWGPWVCRKALSASRKFSLLTGRGRWPPTATFMTWRGFLVHRGLSC